MHVFKERWGILDDAPVLKFARQIDEFAPGEVVKGERMLCRRKGQLGSIKKKPFVENFVEWIWNETSESPFVGQKEKHLDFGYQKTICLTGLTAEVDENRKSKKFLGGARGHVALFKSSRFATKSKGTELGRNRLFIWHPSNPSSSSLLLLSSRWPMRGIANVASTAQIR